jgi:Tol biopolymer transport system component
MKSSRALLYTLIALAVLTTLLIMLLANTGHEPQQLVGKAHHDNNPPQQARFITGAKGISDGWAQFSPDGSLVVFSRSTEFGAPSDLYTIPVAGGDARRLSQSHLPLSATRATWSPQGDLLAFIGTDKGRNSLWVINSDGTRPRKLELGGLSDSISYPDWYPDGKQLVVVDTGEKVIKRIDLALGTVTNITDNELVFAGKPSISPDGNWIAFAGQKNVGQTYSKSENGVWVIRSDGSPQSLQQVVERGRHPNWSPDGQRLTFDAVSNKQIATFIVNRDGTNLEQITDYELRAGEPVWSPDGTRILVLAKQRSDTGPYGLAIIELQENDLQ